MSFKCKVCGSTRFTLNEIIITHTNVDVDFSSDEDPVFYKNTVKDIYILTCKNCGKRYRYIGKDEIVDVSNIGGIVIDKDSVAKCFLDDCKNNISGK